MSVSIDAAASSEDKAQASAEVNTGGNVLSKAAYKSLIKESASASPLHAMRRAQVAAQNAPEWVGEAVCKSRLGKQFLGSGKAGVVAPDGLPQGPSEQVEQRAWGVGCVGLRVEG